MSTPIDALMVAKSAVELAERIHISDSRRYSMYGQDRHNWFLNNDEIKILKGQLSLQSNADHISDAGGVVAELQAKLVEREKHIEQWQGLKFSDRNYGAMKSKLECMQKDADRLADIEKTIEKAIRKTLAWAVCAVDYKGWHRAVHAIESISVQEIASALSASDSNVIDDAPENSECRDSEVIKLDVVAWYNPKNKDPGQSVTFLQETHDKWPHLYPVALCRKDAALSAQPVAQPVEQDKIDATRWREAIKHVGGTHTDCGAQRFTLRYLNPVDGTDIMRGGVSGHFTDAIDALIAAQQEGK